MMTSSAASDKKIRLWWKCIQNGIYASLFAFCDYINRFSELISFTHIL